MLCSNTVTDTVRHVGIFWPSFVNCSIAPTNLLSGSTPPPFSKSMYNMYIVQTVCGWEGVGGGYWVVLETIFGKEFCTLYVTRFKTYKIALLPQNKNLGGEEASDR